jgi:hypothetical protein
MNIQEKERHDFSKEPQVPNIRTSNVQHRINEKNGNIQYSSSNVQISSDAARPAQA